MSDEQNFTFNEDVQMMLVSLHWMPPTGACSPLYVLSAAVYATQQTRPCSAVSLTHHALK